MCEVVLSRCEARIIQSKGFRQRRANSFFGGYVFGYVLKVVLVWATTTSYQVYLSCDSLVRGMGGIENDGI